MANGMLESIEEILKETDEIKAKLKDRGLNPKIKIESSMSRFDFDFKININLEY